MDRREKLITEIDLSSSIVAEIGALCNPLLTKAEADIRYIDYADAETLRKHYSGNPLVDQSRIVETDAIWGKQTLIEALKQRVDFIIASHVIEHVPDLITWLSELHSALTPEGQVRLAIPDKRFTFDFLRRETQLSDVLAAYVMSARIPQPHAILDYYPNATEVDCMAAWRGEVNEHTLRRPATFEPAMRMARDALANGAYHDAHCWVFTPRSFAILLERLGALGMVRFACERFFDTERDSIEFFVALRPSDSIDEVTSSWRRMAQTTRVGALGSIADLETPLSAERSNIAQMEAELHAERQRSETLAAELGVVRRSLQSACNDVRLLTHSHSWKITRPLRSVSRILRWRKV